MTNNHLSQIFIKYKNNIFIRVFKTTARVILECGIGKSSIPSNRVSKIPTKNYSVVDSYAHDRTLRLPAIQRVGPTKPLSFYNTNALSRWIFFHLSYARTNTLSGPRR